MSKPKTTLEHAAGLLVSTLQKEWFREVGTDGASFSEEVVGRAHELISAAKIGSLRDILVNRSVAEFLGSDWVAAHPWVGTSIRRLEHAAGMLENFDLEIVDGTVSKTDVGHLLADICVQLGFCNARCRFEAMCELVVDGPEVFALAVMQAEDCPPEHWVAPEISDMVRQRFLVWGFSAEAGK